MNITKLLKSVQTLKTVMAIRTVLATLSEEDLVAVDEFLSINTGEIPDTARRTGADMQAFTRLLMFFRSEVSQRCLSLEDLKKLSDEIKAEPS